MADDWMTPEHEAAARDGFLSNPVAVEYIDGGEPGRQAWDGQYVDLNRTQINELIRSLRHARDQAFGRDE